MITFFKKNKFFLIGFFVLGWVLFINLFPSGYILVGGDTSQFINVVENFKDIFFDWSGSGSIFLSLFYFLNKIGFSDSQQLSFYLGIFVIGSYLSFYFFLKIVFEEANDLIRSVASVFYALNIYTLYVFTYAWGYSPIQSIYIFVPILVGLWFVFLKKQKTSHAIIFVIILFFASSGFLNPAFALSFFIFLVIFSIALVILRVIKLDKAIIFKILLLGTVSFLVNAYWIFPTMPKMGAGVENLFSNNIELNWWLMHSSNPIIDTLRLSQDNEWYFPDNFPYQKIAFLKPFFVLLTCLPLFVWLWGALNLKKFKLTNRRIFVCFSVLLVVLILVVAKVRPPFEVINHYFYNIWGLNTLRGYEKFAIFTPFVFAVFFFITLVETKRINKFGYVFIFLIIITPLPFFIGKIQQNMSAQFYTYKMSNRNYKNADHSFLVKVPKEYDKIKQITDKDTSKSFITVLPNNNSNTWTDFPKWKLYGIDITKFLHKKKYIALDNFFESWRFFREFKEDNSGEYLWFIKLIGVMNSEYVLFHKDVSDELVAEYEGKIRTLEKQGILKKIEENNYFVLYKINKSWVLPYITYQKEIFEWQSNPIWIERNIQKIIESSAEAPVREINPKKFEINFINSDFSKNIILAEKYDPLWKAYAVDKNGRETEIEDRFLARGYANGWEIKNPENISKIIIEYYPIRLMWRGIWISGLTITFLLIYLVKYYYVKRKVVKN